ncbi:MAG: HD domain-containing protein [Myxococcota bacterium]
MILRDPVHGLVDFEGLSERVVEALLQTREVQRLRRVRQLGLTSLVFPGAEHSRFSHALGAAHVMDRLLVRLRQLEAELPADMRIDDAAHMDAIAAALLHDLGHGPFSHLFEDVLPGARHHEEWSVEAIAGDGTDVRAALEGLSAGMAERVAALLSGKHRLPYLARSVSGTWDVDRADYLLRDSHMTGVRYGLYDLDWLLRAFTVAPLEGIEGAERWVIAIEGRKGLPPIEGFFLARHYMFAQVYHHKATRAAEALIRAIFARVVSGVRAGDAPATVPAAIVCAALGEPVRLGDYLALDDARILSAIADWRTSDDRLLAGFCDDLMARRLPKTLPLPEHDEALWTDVSERAAAIAADAGFDPSLHVRLDVARDVPFSEGEGPSGVWVQIRHRSLQRLSSVSFLLGQLCGKRVQRPRLIFPASLRGPIRRGVQDLIDSAISDEGP